MDKCARPLGDQDLPAVGGCGDAGPAVHIDADVVISCHKRLSGVKAHPDA